MDDLWAYPYRFGIGVFMVVGTFLLMFLFIGFAAWLERDFKKDKSRK